jgi:hypothetical protein
LRRQFASAQSGLGVYVRFWRILLKKSFWGGSRNFLEPLMRFVRDDARDLVASQENDHDVSHRRYGAS